MKAFENCERTKDELLASLARHRAADNLAKGVYWENGRGCAVGCSIHDFRPGAEDKHWEYGPLFAIPEALAHLEDTIFEMLPQGDAMEWPERFVRAIKPGADLTDVARQYVSWLFTGEDAPSKWLKWLQKPPEDRPHWFEERPQWLSDAAITDSHHMSRHPATAKNVSLWVARRVKHDSKPVVWQTMADKLISLLKEAG